MKILAIETSCDETAAAVLTDGGRTLLSNVIVSQVPDHRPFGGIVPELAARRHVELIQPVVEQALEEAGLKAGDLDGVCVTRGPGLIVALLVGVNFAKGLAWSLGVPLAGVHHLEGHLAAPLLERDEAEVFPCVALVVSGGHTSLYSAQGFGRYRRLGRTVDDAAGEAFDKVARLLGLGYPGGPAIERVGRDGDPAAFAFPRPALRKLGLNFSFSGLKTAVARVTEDLGQAEVERRVADLAASFQAAVVDVLIAKTLAALLESGFERVVLSGGVAANGALRERFVLEAKQRGFEVVIPPRHFCTDNAAMIGAAGARRLEAGQAEGPDLDADAAWALPEAD